MNYPPLAPSPFYLYNIPMSSCRTEFPQHYPPLPKTQMPAYLQKGLDMIVSNSIILTAHSSQLTAHSSQLTAHSSLDNFLSFFQHKVHHLFSSAKAKRQHFICFFQFIPIVNSAYYRRSRQVIWFDSS